MYGNIVNNRQLKELVESKTITIFPWNESHIRAQLAHYPLHPGKIFKIEPNGRRAETPAHDFASGKEFVLEENEYVIVEIAEIVILCDGIFGQFIPASSLIEKALSITAGKLDPNYGEIDDSKKKSTRIVFGLKNQLNAPNNLKSTDRLAYLQLSDLRPLNNIEINPDKRLKKLAKAREAFLNKAIDDGVEYPNED